MKRLLIALCVVGLTGCVTVPVSQNFPKASDTLQKAPPELKEIPAGASASVIFDTVVENYGTYNEVATQLKGWQQWYVDQKKIFESAK
jgi:uncharacterized protein YceK